MADRRIREAVSFVNILICHTVDMSFSTILISVSGWKRKSEKSLFLCSGYWQRKASVYSRRVGEVVDT